MGEHRSTVKRGMLTLYASAKYIASQLISSAPWDADAIYDITSFKHSVTGKLPSLNGTLLSNSISNNAATNIPLSVSVSFALNGSYHIAILLGLSQGGETDKVDPSQTSCPCQR